MRFADPLSVRAKATRVSVLFAASQRQGERETQEDYFANFNDQCFAVADGVGGLANGQVAAHLACETALWAYRHVRIRPFYWTDKRLLLRRIFRTTNITLWQKQREKGYEAGLATTLVVCIVGDKSFWVGGVGDSHAYQLTTKGELSSLLPDDVDPYGKLTKVVGANRYGLVPNVAYREFVSGDTMLFLTDGVWRYVGKDQLTELVKNCGKTTESLDRAITQILEAAEKAGSTDNMTAVLIKRVTS